ELDVRDARHGDGTAGIRVQGDLAGRLHTLGAGARDGRPLGDHAEHRAARQSAVRRRDHRPRERMTGRVLGATLLAAACLVAHPATALADGDPASDFLLSQTTFLPFDSNISKEDGDRLNELVAEAKKRGYTIRVAIIGKPFDLGAVPSLWAKPKTYARF